MVEPIRDGSIPACAGEPEKTGAKLLSYTLSGEFRRPKDSDIARLWKALYELHGLILHDPSSKRWVNMANIEPIPKDKKFLIGPPAWRRFGKGSRYTLTAEGGLAGRSRIIAGKHGLGGRLITGIEYTLAALYFGSQRSRSPALHPANGKSGPGTTIKLPYSILATMMGEKSPRKDDAMRKRLNRAIDRLEPYYKCKIGGEAVAGDSIEIIDRVKGSRNKEPELIFRPSGRFVEAARLANLDHGEGFNTVSFLDWIGLRLGSLR